MKKIYFSVCALLLSATVDSQILVENFDYGTTADTITGVTTNWTIYSGKKPAFYQPSPSLTLAGYSSTGVGGSVVLGDSTLSNPSGAALGDVKYDFGTANYISAGTAYGSALINVSEASAAGEYFLHFTNGSSNFYSRLSVKKDASDNLFFGITRAGGTGSSATYGTTPFALNTDYLVVIKYDYATAESKLYVLTAASPTEPGTAEATNNTGTQPTAAIQAISLRQGLFSSQPKVRVDAIKVATNWGALFENSTPTVSFANSAPSSSESAGAQTVTMIISPVSANAETIDVTIADVSATNGADYTTTPSASNFTLDIPANTASISFVVNLTDDAIIETNETFTATLSNPSSGLTLGTSTLTFTILDNDAPVIFTPIYDIQYTTNSDSTSMLTGQTVNTGGIVSAIATVPTTSKGFWINASTGGEWSGIKVFYGSSSLPSGLAIGDSVNFTAVVDEYTNSTNPTSKETELKTITNFTIVSSGNSIAQTAILTDDGFKNEKYEGVLVTFLNAKATDPMNSFGEYKIDDGSGKATIDTLLYDPNFVVNSIYDVTGVVSKQGNLYNNEVYPRFASDIVLKSAVGVLTHEINVTKIYPTVVESHLTIINSGNTDVTILSSEGRKIKSHHVNSNEFMLDVTNLQAGVYFIQTQNEVIKFIKK